MTRSRQEEEASDDMLAAIAYARVALAARAVHAGRAAEAQGWFARVDAEGRTEDDGTPVSSEDVNRYFDEQHPRASGTPTTPALTSPSDEEVS